MGYHRAGFSIVGVDHDAGFKRHYPFTFQQYDALEYLGLYGARFDVVTGSPPCQAHSTATHGPRRVHHLDFIAATRLLMAESERPYVIENVPRAPLRDPIMLCGSEFSLTANQDGLLLQLRRHRLFESNVALQGAGGCQHLPGVRTGGVYGHGGNRTKTSRRHGGEFYPRGSTRAALLGIDWPMTLAELNQAVPPAYTEHIGRQLMQVLT
jgi:DNA (cytosine-5)-methyltransferase 1